MPRYWWVNHNQTFHQEINGHYLWSPKAEANGARSQFYDNMRLAAPNDLVLSFANARIAFVGRVSDFALSAPKPSEFGTVGANWAAEGWLLPVAWQPLNKSVRPKDLMLQLAPILPTKYSPVNPRTGNGNQKTYLAEINRAVFQLVTHQTEDHEFAISDNDASTYSFSDIVNELDKIVEKQVEQDNSLTITEKAQLIKARRGQGIFRSNVGQIENGCRVTGITNQRLLLASHIKPWRSCSNSQERLDGYNGLLLTPDADFLFDRGLISFAESGQILISSKIEESDLDPLGMKIDALAPAKNFVAKQGPYLEYHRAMIFVQ